MRLSKRGGKAIAAGIGVLIAIILAIIAFTVVDSDGPARTALLITCTVLGGISLGTGFHIWSSG